MMMCQEKLFGLRGRLKSCHAMTFGSIFHPLFYFAIRFVFVEMGVGSFPRRHLKTGVRKAKKQIFTVYDLNHS